MNTKLLQFLAGAAAGALTASAQPAQSSSSDVGAGAAGAGSISTTTTSTEVIGTTGSGAFPSTTLGPSSHTAFDPIGHHGSGQSPVRDPGAVGGAGAGLPTGAMTTRTDPLAAPADANSSSSTLPLGHTSTLSSAPAGTTITSRPITPGVSPGTDPVGPLTVTTTTTTQRPPGVSPQTSSTRLDSPHVNSDTSAAGARPVGDTSVSTTILPTGRVSEVDSAKSAIRTNTAPASSTTTASSASANTPTPPATASETIPPAPGPNHVWIRGHHVWSNGQWTWTGGRWALPPQPNMVWVDSRFDAQTQRWLPGYWSTETPAPSSR